MIPDVLPFLVDLFYPGHAPPFLLVPEQPFFQPNFTHVHSTVPHDHFCHYYYIRFDAVHCLVQRGVMPPIPFWADLSDFSKNHSQNTAHEQQHPFSDAASLKRLDTYSLFRIVSCLLVPSNGSCSLSSSARICRTQLTP